MTEASLQAPMGSIPLRFASDLAICIRQNKDAQIFVVTLQTFMADAWHHLIN